MTVKNENIKPDFGEYQKSTLVNTSQSDIQTVARAEHDGLRQLIKITIPKISDAMSRYHLEDVTARITLILELK